MKELAISRNLVFSCKTLLLATIIVCSFSCERRRITDPDIGNLRLEASFVKYSKDSSAVSAGDTGMINIHSPREARIFLKATALAKNIVVKSPGKLLIDADTFNRGDMYFDLREINRPEVRILRSNNKDCDQFFIPGNEFAELKKDSTVSYDFFFPCYYSMKANTPYSIRAIFRYKDATGVFRINTSNWLRFTSSIPL